MIKEIRINTGTCDKCKLISIPVVCIFDVVAGSGWKIKLCKKCIAEIASMFAHYT